MIIGLTGSYAAGKDAVARFLVEKGFSYYSLSDLLRKELSAEGRPSDRNSLIAKGNELRKKLGSGELAQRITQQMKKDRPKRAVVVSIRNPEEVNYLRKKLNFELWFVDAPLQVRYQRAVERMRSEDGISLEKFEEQEKSENSGHAHKQQLGVVAKMADETVINDKDMESLFEKINKLLRKWV